MLPFLAGSLFPAFIVPAIAFAVLRSFPSQRRKLFGILVVTAAIWSVLALYFFISIVVRHANADYRHYAGVPSPGPEHLFDWIDWVRIWLPGILMLITVAVASRERLAVSLREILATVTVIAMLLGIAVIYRGKGVRMMTPPDSVKLPKTAIATWDRRGNLRSLSFAPGKVDLTIIRDFQSLPALSLADQTFDEAQLGNLQFIPNLRELDLSNSSVTDVGLHLLPPTMRLQVLDLRGTRISDNGVQAVSGIRTLSRISLSKTRVTDECIKYLVGMSALSQILAEGTQMSGVGFRYLSNTRSLKVIILNHSMVDNAGLQTIIAIPSVEVVEARGTYISPGGVATIEAELAKHRRKVTIAY